MSSEARKFLLIDSSNIDQLLSLHHSKSRLEPIERREVKKIDEMMLAIVNNPKLTESEKVSEYNRTLTEFQNAAIVRNVQRRINDPQKYTKPQRDKDPQREVDETQKDIKADGEESTNDLKSNDSRSSRSKSRYNVYAEIDHRYKAKAKQLLSSLKNVQYSDTGEVLIHGHKIPGSNISKLLNKAVNPRAKRNDTEGWELFAALLPKTSTPQTAEKKKIKTIKSSPSPQKYQTYATRRRRGNKLDNWEEYDSQR